MLIKKSRLLLLSLPLFLVPTLSLASCASVSQFGTFVEIDFGANNPFADTDINTKDIFGYDAFSGNFYKDEKKYDIAANREFSSFFSYLEGMRFFVDTLVTKSHYDRKLTSLGKLGSLFSGPSGLEEQKKMDEFSLASANILNQGDDGDLKFGINKITIENMPTTANIFNLVSVDPEANPQPTPSEITLLNKDKKTLKTISTTTAFSLSFNYTYYNTSDSNVFNNSITDLEVVNNYIKRDGAWKGEVATVLNWKVSVPLKAIFRSVYSTTRDLKDAIDGQKFSYNNKGDKDKDSFSSIDFYIDTSLALGIMEYPFLYDFKEIKSPDTPEINDVPAVPPAEQVQISNSFANSITTFNKWLTDMRNASTFDKLKDFSNSLSLMSLPYPPIKP